MTSTADTDTADRPDLPARGRGRRRASGGTETGAAGASRRLNLRPLARMLPYLALQKGRVAAAIVALLMSAAATLTVPIAVRRMIDHGFTSDGSGLIDQYFLFMVLVVLVLAGASASRYYLVTTLGERVVAYLRRDVFEKVLSLSPGFFDQAKTGEVTSRLTADTTQIKGVVGSTASQALRNLVLFVGAAAMMVATSPRLSLYVLVAIPVIVLPLVLVGRAVRGRSRAAQDRLADATAFASEVIAAVRTVQAFGAERRAAGRYAGAVEEAFTAAAASTQLRALLTFVGIFLVFASVVLVLWVGAQDVLAGRMTAGELGQFVLFAVFAAGALGELSQVWGDVAQAAGAAERCAELLSTDSAVQAPARPVALPARLRGEVGFAGVRFAYPTRPEGEVLGGVSLTVKPGERVAIVGPSGAGKSTLFHLLLRFYDPQAGAVLLDGIRLTETDPLAIRRHVALVPQDVVVFSGSVAENIRVGRPDASDAEVEEAARQAHAHEFVERLPQGYATEIGERGVTLSGGQRQRVAIARAILKDAPILLLDEATSALDAESEGLVKDALAKLMQGRTTLVIAHRLATVQEADRILVMEGGQIVEEGTHETLIAAGGLYARLARLQFNAG